jgi:hypothetical protein
MINRSADNLDGKLLGRNLSDVRPAYSNDGHRFARAAKLTVQHVTFARLDGLGQFAGLSVYGGAAGGYSSNSGSEKCTAVHT